MGVGGLGRPAGRLYDHRRFVPMGWLVLLVCHFPRRPPWSPWSWCRRSCRVLGRPTGGRAAWPDRILPTLGLEVVVPARPRPDRGPPGSEPIRSESAPAWSGGLLGFQQSEPRRGGGELARPPSLVIRVSNRGCWWPDVTGQPGPSTIHPQVFPALVRECRQPSRKTPRLRPGGLWRRRRPLRSPRLSDRSTPDR